MDVCLCQLRSEVAFGFAAVGRGTVCPKVAARTDAKLQLEELLR